MSADLLREAARKMREEAHVVRRPYARQERVAVAVADLLDNEASLIASVEAYPDLHTPLNLARVDLLLSIARTYLGDES